MKNLKMDLDDLTVQSFETSPGASGSDGTVHGQTFTEIIEECLGGGPGGGECCGTESEGQVGCNYVCVSEDGITDETDPDVCPS